ncbi:polyphosphate kinase 2 family protein [Luteolibacter sp. AS25]|uniref:polyphosphate kinase 2 family protein n=1 Tax=Luteolibacter sp. AS25 TaxID=3135776 RepID=UPI00398AFC2F
MPVQGAKEKYLVEPGSKVNLKKLETDDRSLYDDGGKEEGKLAMNELLEEMRELQRVLYAENKHRILVVIQAMDTGGKDGCVKSVFPTVDPQGIHVEPFKKPSEEELAHDFLWRVHAKVPRNGQIVVFNRSHYEDIIAVKVKKIYEDKVWKNRYGHVVDFERMLSEEGTTIVKIYLHISKEEQRQRLESRLENPDKHWKFNPDDLKDRALWDDFMVTYEDVLSKTSTKDAPWYVVPADRKWYRNLVVARIMVDTLKKLNMQYPEITWDPSSMKIED